MSKLVFISVTIAIFMSACGNVDEPELLGQWVGTMSDCDEETFNGADVTISIINDGDDGQVATIQTGIPAVGSMNAVACEQVNAPIDGEQSSARVTATENCDETEYEYVVDIAVDENNFDKASGFLNYNGGVCTIELTEMSS